jgi:Tetratricopeptide repeat.
VAHDNLAENYVRQGKYEEALREYRWALALNIFEAKIPSIKQSIIQVYLLLNRPEEAKKTINEILKDYPQFYPFEMHFLLGDCYRIKGEFDPAAKEYMIALFFKPDYGLVRFRLAGLYLKLHKNELALKEIADALSVDKALLTGKGAPAIKDYEKVIEIKDSEAASYTKLGMLFVNNNLTSLAKIAFQKAIERSSIYADPYWQLGGDLL